MSLIESFVPVVKYHGLNTNKNTNLGGDVSVGGSVNSSGVLTAAQVASTPAIALAATGAQTIDASVSSVVTIAPTANLTLSIENTVIGQQIVVKVVQGTTTSRTITLGTGFRATGNLATGTTANRAFMLTFVSDGTNAMEVSRTTAIDVS